MMKCNENIPKTIHYCWFGKNPLPSLAMQCIESWKKLCPDFEIKEWNEDNFDLNCNKYVKQAYESKKWAFVSDYVRLRVLYDFGGIYMDTDVQVVRSLDEFLHLPAFSGFEAENRIPTGIIGSKKKNRWIEELLRDYDNRLFIKPDGNYDLTTNVQLITNTTKKLYKINLNNSKQSTADVTFYPFEFFCAKSIETGKIMLTNNTYTIHHFSGSWLTSSQKLKLYLKRIIGQSGMTKLSNIKQLFKSEEPK